MQETSRNVAISGTGDSVSTTGASGFIARQCSMICLMLAAFSSTELSRNTCRSASKISSGTPRQKTPPVSLSSQTSASPNVNTNAPAFANSSA